MNKKSVSTTILILFLAVFFAVIGSCFATFIYKETRTLVEAVKVVNEHIVNGKPVAEYTVGAVTE